MRSSKQILTKPYLKTTRTDESSVEKLETISHTDDEDVRYRLRSVDLGEKLIDNGIVDTSS